MMKFISVVCLALFSSRNTHAQIIHDSLLIDGHYRVFHFSKPKTSKTGGSLVFVLHGSGGKGEDMLARAAKLEERSHNETCWSFTRMVIRNTGTNAAKLLLLLPTLRTLMKLLFLTG